MIISLPYQLTLECFKKIRWDERLIHIPHSIYFNSPCLEPILLSFEQFMNLKTIVNVTVKYRINITENKVYEFLELVHFTRNEVIRIESVMTKDQLDLLYALFGITHIGTLPKTDEAGEQFLKKYFDQRGFTYGGLYNPDLIYKKEQEAAKVMLNLYETGEYSLCLHQASIVSEDNYFDLFTNKDHLDLTIKVDSLLKSARMEMLYL